MTWQGLDANEWLRSFLAAVSAGRELPVPPPETPAPFSLSDPDRIHAVLGSGACNKVELEGVSEPMWFGSDAEDATRFVGGLLNWP